MFLATFDGPTFRGPGWPTRDGSIPWRLFWVLAEQLEPVRAGQRLHGAIATAHGIGVALAGDESRVRQFTAQERDAAAGHRLPRG